MVPMTDEMNAVTLKRLRLLRSVTVAAPWLALIVFVALRLGFDQKLAYTDGFPDADRRALTALILASGAVCIISWVFLRRGGSPSVRAVITTVCYVLALWVALLGAAAWGRGAPMLWFAFAYAWAIGVMWALFPLQRENN